MVLKNERMYLFSGIVLLLQQLLFEYFLSVYISNCYSNTASF